MLKILVQLSHISMSEFRVPDSSLMSLSHHVFTRGQKDLYSSHIKRSKNEEGEKKQGGNVFFFQGGGDSRCPITFDICRKIVKNHNIDRGAAAQEGQIKKTKQCQK